jgi:GT2 family glycosyltransferase
MQVTTRVVIIDYDGRDVFPGCARSLAASVSPSTKITIIDNASPSPSQDLVPPDLAGRFEIIRLDKNIGYAGAIAKAWAIGDETYLVVANNDLEFTPGWLDALVETAERTGAHAVSAVIVHENETDLEKSTNASLNPLLHLIPGVFKDRTKAVYPSGACFLLRRDETLKQAPVDPEYFLYYEDVYLGFLLRSLGKTVVQCPTSMVMHAGSHAARRSSAGHIAFLQERNRLMTQLLFFDLSTLCKLSPLIFVDSLLKIPQCLLRRKPVLPTIGAHWWVLFNLGSILKKKANLRQQPDFRPERILPYLTGKVLPTAFAGAGFWNAISTGCCRLMGIPVDREARDG